MVKLLKLLIVFVLCLLSSFGSAYAQSDKVNQQKPWENPKLSPTQRWNEMLENNFDWYINHELSAKQSLKYKNNKVKKYYFYIDLLLYNGFKAFWKSNNRPAKSLEDLCNSVFSDIDDNLQYKVSTFLNPITNLPIKQVPFDNPSPGDITYIHYQAHNGVDFVSIIVWNEKIIDREVDFARLIEANGGIVKYLNRNELFGFDSFRNIKQIMRLSVKENFYWCHLPGQPMKYSDENRLPLSERWGNLLKDYEALSYPFVPPRYYGDPIFKPLDKSLIEEQSYSDYSDTKLTPEQRWQFISSYLHSNQPESYQNICKNESRENYLIKLDYILHFGIQAYAQQFNKLPVNIDELLNTEIAIANAPVKIGAFQNIYFCRPIQQTMMTNPAPGDISYFVDNPHNPQKVIAFVWSQAPDNEEMFWLQLFDKTYGMINFCTDPTTKEFRLYRGTFLTQFSISIDRAFFISRSTDREIIINKSISPFE